MMQEKLKVIDKSDHVPCWSCNGTGKVYHEAHTQNGQPKGYGADFPCEACEGTGKFREPSYIHIAEQPDGQKIAFQSDFIK